MTCPCYIKKHLNIFFETSLYTTNPPIPDGSVKIGAVVSFSFNYCKLSSYSLDHSNFTSFRANSVKELAIVEDPFINLR
jgi:hypothetical protein